MTDEFLLLLDFGSQYTQLIARRVREQGIFCEIHPYTLPIEEIRQKNPKGIILSGGPANVYAKNAPKIDKALFELGIPVLGICYGLQLIAHLLGGKVSLGTEREYGKATLEVLVKQGQDTNNTENLIPQASEVWMSHGDKIEALPENFVPFAKSTHSPFAAIGNFEKKIFGVQFHPEVSHTPNGGEIFRRFARQICEIKSQFTPSSMIEHAIEQIQNTAKEGTILCGLSGGVDSAVAAVLCHRAVEERVFCIFVDNGLLRAGESDQVLQAVKSLGIRVKRVDASEKFLTALEEITDPEQKRKTIGRVFIEVFEEAAKEEDNVRFLAQGTLYPDVIESVSAHGGPSVTIKSHHNVGGLPERMNLSLVEPLRELFKDEVRQVGLSLGISPKIIGRHPFPGPGLAIRILGKISKERLEILRKADKILQEELYAFEEYDNVWQALAVLLPVQSVGVKGDQRSYEATLAIRAVTSLDGMTADWARLPYECLASISTRILNEVDGIGRVVYDISQKPPATIEWE